ncbi:hypothetical protein D3C87_2175120 [compost metagenome]
MPIATAQITSGSAICQAAMPARPENLAQSNMHTTAKPKGMAVILPISNTVYCV